MVENKKWMAIVGKTKHKTISMSKRIISTLYYICFIAALFLIIYRWYLRSVNRNGEAETIQWTALALLLVAFICRFVPKIFSGRTKHDGSTSENTGGQIHNE
jgi:hypothetical protein